MKSLFKITVLIVVLVSVASCKKDTRPNYQFMPNMYEPVGYETYSESNAFKNGNEAQLPAEGSIPRGFKPFDFDNTNEGYELAKSTLTSPLDSTQIDTERGKILYDIYCGICHGNKGDGQGNLVKREKILGVPSYDDAGRNISEGGVYHVQMFGLNSMGSYASQTNELERWQITQHVMNLKAALKGEPLVTPESIVAPTVEETTETVTTETEH